MSNPFSGNTQHATMWNVGQIDEEERLRNDLEKLEEKRKSLLDRLYVEGAEDQQVGRELDAVVKEIDALTQQMKNKGFLGGRRKKRTHRRSKSRRSKSRSKSCAKKSRRSKH